MIDNIFAHFYDFCRAMNDMRGTINKSNCIRVATNSDDRLILKYLLDGNVVTGISTARINKQLAKPLDSNINMNFADMMTYIVNHPATDDTLWVAQSYVAKVSDYYVDDDKAVKFCKDLITKKLRLGVDAKTVNKALGYALVPSFDVQLAKSIENVKLPVGKWFSVSQKINGNRCVCYRGKMYSRQGKEWKGLEHILCDIKMILDPEVWCLDGELVYKNPENLTDNDAFVKGTGILNSDSEDKSCIKYVIFDWIPNREFDMGVSSETYKERKKYLVQLSEQIERYNLKNIEVVKFFYEGNDNAQIDRYLDVAIDAGMEGVMVNYDVPYQCKRHSGIMKVKRFYTVDLPIVSVEEGEGRLAGTLGKVNVAFNPDGNAPFNTVGVGSGFSDELRSEIWTNKDRYIGRVIEVKYKNVTHDKITRLAGLQFPVFVRFRDDKTECSYD